MGCYMTERMHIIHSETVKGAGLFQCWAFGTDISQDFFDPALTSQDLATYSIGAIDAAKNAGEIDDPENLKNNAVYIFSGGDQDVDTPPVANRSMKLVYEHYVVGKLHYVEEDVGHYF